MTLSKIRTFALLGALLAPALPAPAKAQAPALTPVTFSLDFRALGRHAAWYVALDKGYYREAGLNVSIIAGQGTAQAIQALESGIVQFAFSDVAGLVAARANSNATAKMVAVIYQKAPYAIFSWRSGVNVTRPEQLEGLEIGSGAGSFTQKVIEAFMTERGLRRPATYTNVDPSARIGMLAAKRIPAIETFVMSQPGINRAIGAAETSTFLLADHGLMLYSNGILVREDYLKANPALVRGFIAASLRGWRDTIANPAEAADIVVKLNRGLEREVALEEIAIVNNLVVTPLSRRGGLGVIDPDQMQHSVDLILKTTGGAQVSAAQVYDASFLPQPPVTP
ncbi:MAG: ABC transporter substrate-binding protein [Rhizobiales bacterium]|nr:ABC transporter substrate-binding protein [Hyphomicrobiales bacterium]